MQDSKEDFVVTSYDAHMIQKIDWTKINNAGKPKMILKYLCQRFFEIMDRNVREKYMDMLDASCSGSKKKAVYATMFGEVVRQLDLDEKHCYILEGLELFLKANIPLVSIEFDCTSCAICREDLFCANSQVQVLACKHAFHYNCITLWTKKNPSCPSCKANVSSH